jgi:hypothetical protein
MRARRPLRTEKVIVRDPRAHEVFLSGTAHPELQDEVKLGILAGSVVAGLAGWLVLRFAARPVPHGEPA